MKPPMNLVGQTFGQWIVLSRAEGNYRGHSRWVCRCSCGTERIVLGNNLKRGLTVSCGHPARTIGGLWKDFQSEYDTWKQILARCGDPEHPNYSNYGGRGIAVCERWHDFVYFLYDVGRRPAPGLHLDRIDNDGDYRPGNWRWVTAMENSHNSTAVRKIDYRGRSLPIAEWERQLGFPKGTLNSRLSNGWTVERAFTQPVRAHPSRSNGTVYPNLPAADPNVADQLIQSKLDINPPLRKRPAFGSQ